MIKVLSCSCFIMKEALKSRSQRKLNSQIIRAAERRECLLEAGRLSLESGLGQLVIIVSQAPSYKAITQYTPKQQWRHFMNEAERLAQERTDDHQDVLIRPKAVIGDMKLDFANPEVTDLILIGHGSIDSLWVDGSNKYFSWHQAAKTTTDLKQGKIEQRMCGNFPLGYNVALGTFAVSRLTNVIAAPGTIVPDFNPSDELFQPVYGSDELDPTEQIAALNSAYAGKQPVVIA